MALTNAEKQKRWREKRNALARGNPEAIEHALLQEVERCRRGELSDQERIALADQLVDKANGHLWRAHELAQMARNVRTGNLQRA
jgi:hypothetical protein